MVRVLIVDDEPTYRNYLARYLTRECYDVQAAGGHAEALAIAQSFSPDVVVADWMLQDQGHGLDVAEALREKHGTVQIVLMTGFPTAAIREEARRTGVRELLEKPFGLAELAQAIAEAAREADPAETTPAQTAGSGDPD